MIKPTKSRKQLSQEDFEIWGKITRTAKPLATGDKNFSYFIDHLANFEPNRNPETKSLKKLKSTTAPVFQPSQQPAPQPIPQPPPQPIDQKTSRKISKGKISIDGRLDLHGYTQEEAYRLLHDYIENAYYTGKRTILVITGKGNLGRGVLRENVPKWLADAPFRLLVSGFGVSLSAHGGVGALYVRIKRKS
jgi:DNA-nicking Smr family endonuclease